MTQFADRAAARKIAGLTGLWRFHHSGVSQNYVSGVTPTNLDLGVPLFHRGSTLPSVASVSGRDLNGVSGQVIVGRTDRLFSAEGQSVLILVRRNGTTGERGLCCVSAATDGGLALGPPEMLNRTTGLWMPVTRGGGPAQSPTTGMLAGWSFHTRPTVLLGVHDGAGNGVCYQDGLQTASATIGSTFPSDRDWGFSGFSGWDAYGPTDTTIIVAATFNRVVSAAEAWHFRNPFALFEPEPVRIFVPAAVGAPDITTGVEFDGATDYALRGGDLTGDVDGKSGSLSCFIKVPTGGSNQFLIANSSNRFACYVDSSGNFFVTGFNAAGTSILSMRTTIDVRDDQWHHIAASWDMISIGNAHLYVDGVESRFINTYTNDDIDYTQPEWAIGATTAGASLLDGCVHELYFTKEHVDFSIQANREKFRDASGNPVSLGSDGSTPTGTQPIIYLSGGALQFFNNFGSGGKFTDQGSVINCAFPFQVLPLDIGHAHTLDLATATGAAQVSPLDAGHAHSLGVVVAIFSGTVAPLDVAHAHGLDQATAISGGVAAPIDVLHAHTLELIGATFSGTVTAQDVAHAHSLEQGTASTGDTLTALALAHGHSLEAPTLTFSGTVAPLDVAHAHALEQATAAGAGTVVPLDLAHAQSLDLAIGQFQVAALPVEVSHGHLLDAVAAIFGGAVSPQNVIHGHILDSSGAFDPALVVLPTDGRIVIVKAATRVVRVH